MTSQIQGKVARGETGTSAGRAAALSSFDGGGARCCPDASSHFLDAAAVLLL